MNSLIELKDCKSKLFHENWLKTIYANFEIKFEKCTIPFLYKYKEYKCIEEKNEWLPLVYS